MELVRTPISSGSPWEPIVGYSRAYRVGDMVFVSGTTGADDDGRPIGDLASQTRAAIEKIGRALEQAGSSLQDVVRTRMFVTDISRWEEIGRVHQEFFGKVMPATSMVEVSRLIGNGIEMEIEAVAVIRQPK